MSNRNWTSILNTSAVCAICIATIAAFSKSVIAFPSHESPRYQNSSDDKKPFYNNGIYDPAIPEPKGTVPRSAEARPIRIHEIHAYFTELAASSPRAQLFEYGRTYENRPLIYLVISSESNMAGVEALKANLKSLANPAGLSAADAQSIIKTNPALTWLAYSIHGDEISGSDAAVELAYQLVAGMDEQTKMLRDSLIIVIDPSENPDGRERYLSMLQSHNSAVPSTDAQALQHGGFWPWGRGNHYLYDLNRDWILLENPETRGKVAAILDWSPQMLVDAHEMGANSTFLFNPPREPINKNIPDTIKGWWQTISRDHAEAFDKHGWSYYTQEWHEEWYPGYGSAWANYIGAIGLLYEQSGADGLPTKQRGGYIQTYREAVIHQFTASIANITTAAKHRTEMLSNFVAMKRTAIEAGKNESPHRFVIPAGKHPERADHLVNVLLGFDVRIERTTVAGTIGGAHDGYGKTHKKLDLPAGSYIVNLNQPLRSLIKAMLEFDPHMTKEFLEEERREQEKWGGSRLYEFSSWSLSLAYDADVIWTDNRISISTEVITSIDPPSGEFVNPDARYGWVIDFTSDIAPIAALRIMSAGYKVQSSSRPFTTGGHKYPAGSLLIRRHYNDPVVQQFLADLANELGITITGANSGLVRKGSDLGADSFRNLELPRIGLFGGPGVSFTSYASLWHQMDQELGARHSLLNLSQVGRYDLDRYNVLVLPDIWGGGSAASSVIGPGGASALKNWVKAGGTLICVGGAAQWAADSSNGVSSVRLLRDVLEKKAEYTADNQLEVFQSHPRVDTNQVWHYKTPAVTKADKKSGPSGDKESREREDGRARSLFSPTGVIFDVLLDNERWLAFGCGEHVPTGLYTSAAFMSKSPVQTIGRIADAESCRLSGLLWPEARERWAKTAYLTRESSGKGQVILFAGDPDFRGYWKGTARLFTNALTLGPGFGTRVSVGW